MWLGLERLHQLTSENNCSLRITLKDFDDKTYAAVYDQFQVDYQTMIMIMMIMVVITLMIQVGPGDDYELTVGGFNDALSTLGDSMITNETGGNLNEMKFSTK